MRVQAEFCNAFFAVYQDDLAAVLPANKVLAFFLRVAELGAEDDASLAPGKCVASSPTPQPAPV